nr:hypothetical protein [uncultured Ottowia sp.]
MSAAPAKRRYRATFMPPSVARDEVPVALEAGFGERHEFTADSMAEAWQQALRRQPEGWLIAEVCALAD